MRHRLSGCSRVSRFKFVGGYQSLKPLTLYNYLLNLGYDITEKQMEKNDFISYDFESYGKKIHNDKNVKSNSNIYLSECIPFSFSVQSTQCDKPKHYCNFNVEKLICQFVKVLENISENLSKKYEARFTTILHDLKNKITNTEKEILELENKLSNLTENKKTKKNLKKDLSFVSLAQCYRLETECHNEPEKFLRNGYLFFKNFPKIKFNPSLLKLDIYHLECKLKQLEKIHNLLNDHIYCHRVCGYNSSSFDTNLVRKYLLIFLKIDNNTTVLKKHNRYLLIQTQKLKFVDVMNFLPPNTSLDKFCRDMYSCSSKSDNIETAHEKGYLPYDKIDSIAAIQSHKLPLFDDFFNILSGRNSFEENITTPSDFKTDLEKKAYISKIAHKRYINFKTFWLKNNFNMQSYIEYYCNKDVNILLNATKKYASVFRSQFKIELFDHISLPQISRKLMRLEAHKGGCILANFSKQNSWIYYALKASLTAGSSQIYTRLANENTYILNNKVYQKKATRPKKQNTSHWGPPPSETNTVRHILGMDCTAMYGRSLMGYYPTNNPICYVKNDPTKKHFSIQKSIQYSEVYLFMHYLERKYSVSITTQRSVGYEIVKLGFPLDGFIEKSQKNIHLFQKIDKLTNTRGFYHSIAVEYHSCYYHSHPCSQRVNDPLFEKYSKTLYKMYTLFKNGIFCIFTYGCYFELIKSIHGDIEDTYDKLYDYPFYEKYKNKKIISSEDIIEGVRQGSFYGFLTVDINTPENHPYINFNDFPPLFCNTNVSYKHWGGYTQKYYSEHISKKDRVLLIQAKKGVKMTLNTELLKFYLSIGLTITHVHAGVEFEKKMIYRKLIEHLISLRREGDLQGNVVLASACKNLINALFGSLNMRIEIHKIIKYLDDMVKIRAKINNPLFYSINHVNDKVYEVLLNKSWIVQTQLIHHASTVLDSSKIIILNFMYNFVQKMLKKDSYKLLSSDTDSAYFALVNSQLSKLIKPQYIAQYNYMVGNDGVRCGDYNSDDYDKVFLPRICCELCKTHDKRSSGIFHIEREGKSFYGPSSKKNIIQDENQTITKLTFAGMRFSYLEGTDSAVKMFFIDPIFENSVASGVNFGIKTHHKNKIPHVYSQKKVFLPGFYIKRLLLPDGINTSCLNITLEPTFNMPENVHFIHNNHYLSLFRKFNILYKSTYYNSLGSFILSCKKLNNEIKHKETVSFIKKCIKIGIFKFEILKSYHKLMLLFPGDDAYLTTCVNSYLDLYFTQYSLIKGSNKLHDIFNSIIIEHLL